MTASEIAETFFDPTSGNFEQLRDMIEQLEQKTRTMHRSVTGEAPVRSIANEITEYLGNGGLFNPEMMDHEKVRDLLMRCREKVETLENESAVSESRR